MKAVAPIPPTSTQTTALVSLDGAPFKKFAACRDAWAVNTDFVYPGPIQYFGPASVCDQPSLTLKYEHEKR